MGWLFKKKSIPFPEPKTVDENELKFPVRKPVVRVIRPEEVKEAAGLERVKEDKSIFSSEEKFQPQPESAGFPSEPLAGETEGPLYIKLQVYKQIVGELNECRDKTLQLQQTSNNLQTSEYNEEHHFNKLKKEVKGMHDYLLRVDKMLFKIQGG